MATLGTIPVQYICLPEDDEPVVGGLVGERALVVVVGDLVPLILVERVLHHKIRVLLEHVSGRQIKPYITF